MNATSVLQSEHNTQTDGLFCVPTDNSLDEHMPEEKTTNPNKMGNRPSLNKALTRKIMARRTDRGSPFKNNHSQKLCQVNIK